MVPDRIQPEQGDRKRPFMLGMKGVVRLLLLSTIATVLVTGCQLVPNKPEAVFDLYRERMKSQQLTEARKLLSDESIKLIQEISSSYNLDQPPENLALLNALDPVSGPTLMKSEPTEALLQVRTLKGGLRLIRLTRKDPDSQWQMDISEELRALESFLKARSALEEMRDQAGEFAASWKAFNRQLDKMHVTEPPQAPPQLTQPKPKPIPEKPKPKPKPKPRNQNKPKE